MTEVVQTFRLHLNILFTPECSPPTYKYTLFAHLYKKYKYKKLCACYWLIEDFRWACLESCEVGVFPELGDLQMYSENRNTQTRHFGQWQKNKLFTFPQSRITRAVFKQVLLPGEKKGLCMSTMSIGQRLPALNVLALLVRKSLCAEMSV